MKIRNSLGLVMMLIFSACNGVDPDDAIVQKCTEDLADTDGCQCAATKFEKYVGAKDFARYNRFLELFFELREANPTDNNSEHWYQATQAYRRETGEDDMAVQGDMVGLASRHADGMKACGLDPYGEKEQ